MDLAERAEFGIDDENLTDEIRQLRFQGFLEQQEHHLRQSFAMRKSFFVNCWYMKAHESAAMWPIYGGSREGVAVTTNAMRVVDALRERNEDIYVPGQLYRLCCPACSVRYSFFQVIPKRLKAFMSDVILIG